MVENKDLIKGEIYVHENNNIFRWHEFHSSSCIGDNRKAYYKDQLFRNEDAKRIATPQEKHWLECCERLGKFVTFGESQLSFVREWIW